VTDPTILSDGGTSMSQNPKTEVVTAAVVESDLVEESLVEEVSIDGMCGVY
jgi:mycofactocin precursor peptide MftA